VLPVHITHCMFQTHQNKLLACPNRQSNDFFNNRILVSAKGFKNEFVHGLQGPRPTYPDLHAGKPIGAQMTNNGLDPFVSSGTAAPHDFDPAQCKIDVVMGDEDVFGFNAEVIDASLDSHTAPVHVCLRTEKDDPSAFQ